MKSFFCAAIAALVLGSTLYAQQPQLPPGAEMEKLEGEVAKIYRSEYKGGRYLAYVLKWNNQEIVVSDPLAISDKKVGDKVTFSAVLIPLPMATDKPLKALQFIYTDYPAGAMEALMKK